MVSNRYPRSLINPKIGLIIIAVAEVKADRIPIINGVAPSEIENGEIIGAMTIIPRKNVNVAR